tara:strand:+ start:245 stop:412 length:168 start_codon:yes stop_codon:yes gene_type:complete
MVKKYELFFVPLVLLIIILLSIILKIMITDYGRINLLNEKIEEKFINNCKREKIL